MTDSPCIDVCHAGASQVSMSIDFILLYHIYHICFNFNFFHKYLIVYINKILFYFIFISHILFLIPHIRFFSYICIIFSAQENIMNKKK